MPAPAFAPARAPVDGYEGLCVTEITGAEVPALMAAAELAQTDPGAAMVRIAALTARHGEDAAGRFAEEDCAAWPLRLLRRVQALALEVNGLDEDHAGN